MKCACGSKLEEAEIEVAGFRVKGFRCENCGEELTNPRDIELIRRLINEPVKVRRVAHSLVITVPQSLTKLAGVKEGEELRWRVSGNQLVLEKTRH